MLFLRYMWRRCWAAAGAWPEPRARVLMQQQWISSGVLESQRRARPGSGSTRRPGQVGASRCVLKAIAGAAQVSLVQR